MADAAINNGSARVIVEHRIGRPYRLEPLLSNATAQAQRADIQRARTGVLALVPGQHANAASIWESIPFFGMEVDAAELATLLRSPDVVAITEDREAHADRVPSIDVPEIRPMLAQSAPLIGAATLWAQGITGAGQAVAILDTGVQKTHTFLTGKVISEACYSTTSAANSTTSVCPGGVAASTATDSGVNCPTTTDGCEHGTHVAGITAGTGPSFSGVAKGASLIAVQVFSQRNSVAGCSPAPSPRTTAFIANINSGLQRVYDLRNSLTIASINMSLGGGRFFNQASCDSANASTKALIDNLRAANIATVIASGNEGYTDSMGAPGCISTAISVGATSKSDVVASFSNSVNFLSVLAPGVSINSSVPVPANGFIQLNGTSMAAPHVAGSWALLKHQKPTATYGEAYEVLEGTGLLITDARNNVPKRRIRVDQAANLLSGPKTLTVTKTGTGTVTSIPDGINCGATCSAQFPVMLGVTLTATAGGGQAFSHFTGGCQTWDNPCNVPIFADTSANATFVTCSPRPKVTLGITKTGDGRLRIAVNAGAGVLRRVDLTVGPNGILDVVGGQANIDSNSGPFGHELASPLVSQTVYLLRRANPGGSAIANFTVTDPCGTWKTFAGGGPSAFQ